MPLSGAGWAGLALSALLALAYGIFGSALYEANIPHALPVALKASGVIALGVIALLYNSRLLAAGLLFGALGDALLAWSAETFLFGAASFLVGHVFYIALFVKGGVGVRAALQSTWRMVGVLALLVAAVLMTAVLVPAGHPLFAPLSVYTGVLTLMAIASLTLPAVRWLGMLGAVMFFISDAFVAAGLFHPLSDPTLAFWRGFIGWMVYWGGQLGICVGALGLLSAGQPRVPMKR